MKKAFISFILLIILFASFQDHSFALSDSLIESGNDYLALPINEKCAFVWGIFVGSAIICHAYNPVGEEGYDKCLFGGVPCLRKMSVLQIADVLTKYLMVNPEIRHTNISDIYIMALQDACRAR